MSFQSVFEKLFVAGSSGFRMHSALARAEGLGAKEQLLSAHPVTFRLLL